jgi:hypothetical protein
MVSLVFRLLLVVMAGLAFLVPLPRAWVERVYSRGLYLAVQTRLTPLANQAPFALFDVLVLALLAVVLVLLIVFALRIWRRPLSAVVRLATSLASLLAVVYLAFLVLWGLNYQRQPLTLRLDYRDPPPATAAVLSLVSEATARLNALHREAHAPAAGSQALPAELAASFDRVQQQLIPGRTAVPGVPKSSWLTLYFERAGVDGMTAPFFLEVLINDRVLPFERPFVVAHEWAHLAGYADEAEANFVGWLTAVQASPRAAYSGWLHLYLQALPAVPARDRAALVRNLGAGPRDDVRAVIARAAATSPLLRSVGWRVYDRYLKANRVEAGVASYQGMVRLLLGTRFEPGWRPARKP